MSSDSDTVTQLLVEWSAGDQQALEKLLPLIYNELRHLAHNFLYRERPGHTLQTTALVHEAYLKLIDQRDARWQNRAHFFAIAAQAMRRILIANWRGFTQTWALLSPRRKTEMKLSFGIKKVLIYGLSCRIKTLCGRKR
jgi:DNA-directed RNA polymerase specialized sigma24 family protein